MLHYSTWVSDQQHFVVPVTIVSTVCKCDQKKLLLKLHDRGSPHCCWSGLSELIAEGPRDWRAEKGVAQLTKGGERGIFPMSCAQGCSLAAWGGGTVLLFNNPSWLKN